MDRVRFVCLFVALSLCCGSTSAVLNTPSVKVTTRLGAIVGLKETIGLEDGYVNDSGELRTYFSFKGVPYAKAPVGNLRWQDPLPIGSWPNELDATNFGPACPQFERTSGRVIGDEDCLFLNVFTPHSRIPKAFKGDDVERQFQMLTQSLMPVMVWFHGGGYVRGGSQQFGPQFMMREDIVLVTVNYRLGIMGFLSTGDEYLAGNYGMLDQIEALKWVRSHIINFGGDPDKVTIFGESAGGSITHLLSLSPLADGLFNKAILQSASGLCEWSVERSPLEHAQQIAEGLKCPSKSGPLADCLRDKTIEELVRMQTDLLEYSLFPVRCAPVIDAKSRENPFLPEDPKDIIVKRRFNPVPLMTGLTANEGLLFYLWIHYENMAKMSNPVFVENELVPGVIRSVLSNRTEVESLVSVIQQQYFGDLKDYSDSTSFVPRFVELMDDALFTSCVYAAQTLHSKASSAPIYGYLFSYKGTETPSYAAAFGELVRRSGFDHPMIVTGVTHGDELLYLFRMAGLNAGYSPTDMKVSQALTRMWANFATTGNPMQGGNLPMQMPVWPTVSQNSLSDKVVYLNIDGRTNPLGADFRKAEHNFWVNVVPHVREMTVNLHLESKNSWSMMWILFGLLVFAVISITVLLLLGWLSQRRKKYPESGTVVLQRCG